MKKHFIAGLLFLNVTCGMQALTSPILSPDAFETYLSRNQDSSTPEVFSEADLNCSPEEEYVPAEQSAFQKIVFEIAERIPEPVMFALVVAYCKYDEYKQRTGEKLHRFMAYLRAKLSCKSIDEHNEQRD